MAHSYTSLYTHFVFSPNDRIERTLPEMPPRLIEYVGGIMRPEKCALIGANAVADHIHLLAQVHPSVAPAALMREVKSRSSSFIREMFHEREWCGWQEGYGAFSVSRSGIDVVKEYIARQEEHHRRMTFQEEFVAMLDKHGIEYDLRYLWD
ncbi:MAG TPA: IS200/IS605 family transposase [Phycisphaerales bacterium]|nr:IS200/IS605 family transposase [Phycisphaerales bacterium]